MPTRGTTTSGRRRGGRSACLALATAACGDPLPPLAPPGPATLAAVRGLAPHPCNATTASVLDARGVGPGTVERIYYDRRVTGNERGILQGYDAWIGLRGRPGDLVVRHDPSCGLIASYTRGGDGAD
jgi:hypothetical protein